MKTWRMTPAEALNCAADIIEQRGWCQYAPTIDGAVCTLAALQIAVTGELKWDFTGFESAPYIDALKRLASFLGIPLGSVCAWNNNRTKEQVIAALRGASK